LATYFKVSAYPTILFLDEEANTLSPVKGYMTPQQLEVYLTLFATNDYKEVKTTEEWTEYQKNFKYTFK
jgi:thioredoxin-related protein